jgi:hypothetical protein
MNTPYNQHTILLHDFVCFLKKMMFDIYGDAIGTLSILKIH